MSAKPKHSDAAYSVPCPTCGAKIGDNCRTPGAGGIQAPVGKAKYVFKEGAICAPHASRIKKLAEEQPHEVGA